MLYTIPFAKSSGHGSGQVRFFNASCHVARVWSAIEIPFIIIINMMMTMMLSGVSVARLPLSPCQRTFKSPMLTISPLFFPLFFFFFFFFFFFGGGGGGLVKGMDMHVSVSRGSVTNSLHAAARLTRLQRRTCSQRVDKKLGLVMKNWRDWGE